MKPKTITSRTLFFALGAIVLTATIVASGLSTDPRSAGLSPLEQVDSDHDAVRDDIQRYSTKNPPHLIIQTSQAESSTAASPNQQLHAIRLGGPASRSYQIILPNTWEWQRSTFNSTSTYGKYGTPYFDERFLASDNDWNRLALIIQSNARDENTPLFPWDSPYCLTTVDFGYSGNILPATAYSDLKAGERVEFGPGEMCPMETVVQFADRHFVELRVCIDSTGTASTPVSSSDYNECPENPDPKAADYLRITFSCQGPAWIGSRGQQNCVSLLQGIINSLVQRGT